MLNPVFDQLRYGLGVRRFLKQALSPAEARTVIETAQADRARHFLSLMERAVFAQPGSPYLALLRHAGFDREALTRLVGNAGLEGALEYLHEAGVYVSLEEFKGKTPIRRGSLEFTATQQHFDNPLVRGRYETPTSGSRGATNRVFTSFESLLHESALLGLLRQVYHTEDRPLATWRPGESLMRYMKAGVRPERWFAPNRWRDHRERLNVWSLLAGARLAGKHMPAPRYTPRSEVMRIVTWLAECTRSGRPAWLLCNASPAVRVCLAARESGADISGTLFQVGGEPLTPAKSAVIGAAGASVINVYAMAELPYIAESCPTAGPVDLHLLTDRLAVLTRDTLLTGGRAVSELFFTTATPYCSKVLLNVASGDYGSLSTRDCGCLLGEMGFTTHLDAPHSYDKLTSEGVTFIGADLYRLLEEVLPSRFGGNPMDYQLVEEEEGGLPRVSVVIAPSVGPVDPDAVVATVLETLGEKPYAGRLMTDEWRQSDTLRVVRREPFETRTSKVLPLHILRAPSTPAEAPASSADATPDR